MINAVKSVLGQYVGFNGRAARAEYWYWVLFYLLLALVLGIVDGAVIAPMLGFSAFESNAGQPLSLIVSLGLLLPSIAVAIRRLHDTDRTGWWLLIGFVPIIGTLVLLFFAVQPGTPGPNRFGEAPDGSAPTEVFE